MEGEHAVLLCHFAVDLPELDEEGIDRLFGDRLGLPDGGLELLHERQRLLVHLLPLGRPQHHVVLDRLQGAVVLPEVHKDVPQRDHVLGVGLQPRAARSRRIREHFDVLPDPA